MRGKQIFIGVILLLVAGGLMFFSARADKKREDLMTSGIKKVGVISRIASTRDSDGNRDYTAYVSYNVNGIELEETMSFYTSGMQEGDPVELYYSKANPRDFVITGELGKKSNFMFKLVTYIFGGLGIIFTFVGTTGIGSSLLPVKTTGTTSYNNY